MLKLPELNVAHVIYFPVPNPSGFVHNSPLAYPTGITIADDFPLPGLLGDRFCNRTSTVRVLDHIFRTHKIDLTVQLRTGRAFISHSWTDVETKKDVKADEQPIFDWIHDQLNIQFKAHNAKEKIKHVKYREYPTQ